MYGASGHSDRTLERPVRDEGLITVPALPNRFRRDDSAAQLSERAAALADPSLTAAIRLYGGVGHGFTNRDVDEMRVPGLAYHERSDKRSWESMLRLFSEAIDG